MKLFTVVEAQHTVVEAGVVVEVVVVETIWLTDDGTLQVGFVKLSGSSCLTDTVVVNINVGVTDAVVFVMVLTVDLHVDAVIFDVAAAVVALGCEMGFTLDFAVQDEDVR